ncbi:MAG: hypothetical protein ONB44_17065 [candidate division KSB1 bacterium]|nr:hypothetical protein [candidate division KSB1 bacterium]MDZ7303846.1 hypothetical protein [candidate division KSB1 bacterium]MDZ7312747.1 hypothetical protein [candidate division KSB1 bacterium]
MTELVLKVDDSLAARFKEISLQKFRGDDVLAFECALKSLLSEEERDLFHLEQIIEQIQDDIERAGGMTDKEIDAYISTFRQKKRAGKRT